MPSQAAEAARAAEFNEKKWVWVPDEKEGYVAGWVHKEEGTDGDIVIASGGEIRRVPLEALSKMNPPKFDRVDDMADLTFLNEASVVHNLRLRYEPGDIYTYSGLFLVAINPYTKLPIYSDATVLQYRGKGRDENPPHIFAIAERAWVNMGEQRENQSILITGESGAGKTENTKKVIQYLAAIANKVTPTSIPRANSSQALTSSGFKSANNNLSNQILQTNPILEAFGNAQTARNNNSSRFGKFVRISFGHGGNIAGANIDWYLLEKSRVVIRSEVERSFHVFYQLLAGGGALKDSLLLEGGISDYEYLNKSRAEVDGVNDKTEFNLLVNALEVVGFSHSEQFDLFRIVAAILHIGNIGLKAVGADSAQITGTAHEKACHLLGIPIGEFTRAVLKPQVLAGREWVTQSRTKTQALNELGALCKTLYERMFGGLVERVNRALERPGPWATFIGVLDIAGFEIFQTNGFEQLCINYTNEKLQQFFNHHMFVLEQEEYQREGIEWNYVNFGLDIQPTIELIESSGPTIGILSCLDEESIMPRATDTTFTEKLYTLWSGDAEEGSHAFGHRGREKFVPVRFEQGFTVKHYAGEVEYRTEGWLEKNKDPLNDNLTRILAGSSDRYIANLFSDFSDMPIPGKFDASTFGRRRVLKKGAFRTVSQRHKEQLASLMAQLQATQPHFVRCIVPNALKKPLKIDVPLVLDQLRCNGVLEGIRIARMGYPNRLPFVEFRQRYELLTPGILPRGYMDGRQACERMLRALELDASVFKIGTTKVFFKAGVLAELEERRDGLLYEVFSRIQAAARMWSARRHMRKILNRAVALKVIQRNGRVYGELRDWPWWQLYTKVRPLLTATRNDEELRRKDAELALAKVQAERDQQEKESLAKLRSQLEQDMKRVQEELDAERVLGVDKDTLLQRSKKRESDLEEDVIALQLDLDKVDSQLDRAMQAQKATEVRFESMRDACNAAVEHLAALETEQKAWHVREAELKDEVRRAAENTDAAERHKAELDRLSGELQASIAQKEQDLQTAKSRAEKMQADLESKLLAETKSREQARGKADGLESEVHHAKAQVDELSKTATAYTEMLQKQEHEIGLLQAELDELHQDRDVATKKITELSGQLESLEQQLQAQTSERQRETSAKARLQKEIDDLRNVMAAKASEDTRRLEVQRSKEKELTNLRSHSAKLEQDLDETRRSASDNFARLKIELEQASQDRDHLDHAHKELLSLQTANSEKRKAAETALEEAQRVTRSLESDLQGTRAKLLQIESEHSEATKAKEALERQLVAAQSKYQDFEDAVLQIEREKATWTRQMESTRKQLDAESYKRAQLEQSAKSHASEMTKLKDRSAKMEKELNKALDDLHDRDWQIKQLVSKQDKTIVEHVHVLEEAKRRTDVELTDLKVEMQSLRGYVRSLEKIRTRLTGEAEDLNRETERERQQIRAKEKGLKGLEDKVSRASAEVEKERKLREATEVQSRRYQSDCKSLQADLQQVETQLAAVKHSKAALEHEISMLVAEGDEQKAVADLRKEYEARISQLQTTTAPDNNVANLIAERVRDRIDREHKEIRNLIDANRMKGDPFATRLLRELDLVDRELAQEFSNQKVASTEVKPMYTNNIPPSQKRLPTLNGSGPRRPSELPRVPEAATGQLREQVQNLEQHIRASDRIRQHLESSMRDLAADLEASDGSKQALQKYRAKLAKENASLSALLQEETVARRSAEATQMDDIKTLWTRFQEVITEEQGKNAKLDESRRALVAQQRTAEVELEDNRRQVQELSQAKKQLQVELSTVKDHLELAAIAKNEEASLRHKAETQLQELAATTSTSSTVQSELHEAAAMYKSKAETYLARLETAEVERAKSSRAEGAARKTWDESEKARKNATSDLKISEKRLREAEQHLVDLQAKMNEGSRELSDFELLRRRLLEEMEDERDQHQKDLAERDFTLDQTRKKYQGELAQSIDELQSLRDGMSRLREENRTVRSELDELQFRYDDELDSGGAWKKEKDRLEARITTLTQAYDTANSKQSEAQTQVVSLLSQNRELRAVLDEANAERAALARARKALELRMNDIAQDHLDNSQLDSDRALQALHLEKQNLRSALQEQNDRVAIANERLKKAEAHANESQSELSRVRDENARIERHNANLDNQVKELNLRIVDLETKSYVALPAPARSRRLESRIEELTSKLSQESQEKSETLQSARDADKTVREMQFRLTESERLQLRLHEENLSYENKVMTMRQAMDDLQNSESALQLAKRRAEREAADFKQRALASERELERLKSRLERPSSLAGTPVSSPTKTRA